VSQKTPTQTFVHIFAKYWPKAYMLKISSLPVLYSHQLIYNEVIIRDPTTPETRRWRRYTTLWNIA